MAKQLLGSEIHPMFDVEDTAVLHPEDIAKLTNMHVESVRRWCRQGKIECYNFGKKYIIVGKDFKDYMRRSKIKPKWVQEIENE